MPVANPRRVPPSSSTSPDDYDCDFCFPSICGRSVLFRLQFFDFISMIQSRDQRRQRRRPALSSIIILFFVWYSLFFKLYFTPSLPVGCNDVLSHSFRILHPIHASVQFSFLRKPSLNTSMTSTNRHIIHTTLSYTLSIRRNIGVLRDGCFSVTLAFKKSINFIN